MKRDVQAAILRACARFIAKRLDPVEARVAAVETKMAHFAAPQQKVANTFDPKVVVEYLEKEGAAIVRGLVKEPEKPAQVDENFSERVSRAVGYNVLVMSR